MYFSDHPPPHIHAQYGGVEAVISISDGAVIRGSYPIERFDSCEVG